MRNLLLHIRSFSCFQLSEWFIYNQPCTQRNICVKEIQSPIHSKPLHQLSMMVKNPSQRVHGLNLKNTMTKFLLQTTKLLFFNQSDCFIVNRNFLHVSYCGSNMERFLQQEALQLDVYGDAIKNKNVHCVAMQLLGFLACLGCSVVAILTSKCLNIGIHLKHMGPQTGYRWGGMKVRYDSNKRWQAECHETVRPDRHTCGDSLFSRAMNIHSNIPGISFTHSSSIQPSALLRLSVFWLTEVRQTALWELWLWNEVEGTSMLNKYSPPKNAVLSRVCCLLRSCFNRLKQPWTS